MSYTFSSWAANRHNTAEDTLRRVELALETETEEGRARRERSGHHMALREQRLAEAADAVDNQVHAEESAYDSTKLFDAALALLSEVREQLKVLRATEPGERIEKAG